MGGSATLVGMYGVIYFTGQRIAAVQMAEIAKQEEAQVQRCCALATFLSFVPFHAPYPHEGSLARVAGGSRQCFPLRKFSNLRSSVVFKLHSGGVLLDAPSLHPDLLPPSPLPIPAHLRLLLEKVAIACVCVNAWHTFMLTCTYVHECM